MAAAQQQQQQQLVLHQQQQQQQGGRNLTKVGELIHQRVEKVNSELLALTYGSLVIQLLKDCERVDRVNAQLERIGVNIGTRLVEEFLAKSGLGACADFKETMDVLAKVGFKMFLGITAEVTDWSAAGTTCTLVISDNPLTDFVELPSGLVHSLHYSNIICGVIRGALEQLYLRVNCEFLQDVLKGDAVDAVRVDLVEILREEFFDDDDDCEDNAEDEAPGG